MSIPSTSTEAVVRNHLQVFLDGKGAAAIVEDYHERARVVDEARIYRGKQEIQGFFTKFLTGLPPGAVSRFVLRTLRVEGNLAYITWSIDGAVPLGTDTFLVEDGKIVSQTFAMYVP